jgi:hypothetical protein
VQTLPSSQFTVVPTQVPAVQVSPLVHAFPSLHGEELFACAQPLAGLQESSVQAFPSSQFTVTPEHAPPAQLSPEVQAFPSLHDVPLGFVGFEHAPVAASQVPGEWH